MLRVFLAVHNTKDMKNAVITFLAVLQADIIRMVKVRMHHI